MLDNPLMIRIYFAQVESSIELNQERRIEHMNVRKIYYKR